MNEASRFIVEYCVNSAFEAPLLLLAASLLARLLRRISALAEHRAWIAALVLAVIVPASAPLFHPRAAGVHLAVAATINSNASLTANAMRHADRTLLLAPSFYRALLFAYLATVVIAALRLAISLQKIRTLRKASVSVSLTPQAVAIWIRCTNSFAVRSASLATVSQLTGPITLGCRKPLLLLPPGFLAESAPDEIAAALAHECAHIERHDFLLNLLYRVLGLLLAWHPAVWLIQSRIAATREVVCDRMAADRIAGLRPYARSLLRLAAAMHAAQSSNPHPAIGLFDAGTLENRLMNLTASRSALSPRSKFVLVASAVLLFGLTGAAAYALSTNVVELQGVDPTHNPVAASSASGSLESTPRHVYQPGGDVSNPVLTYAPDPNFPRGETKQGVVVVGCIVEPNGLPTHVHVDHSLARAYDTSALRAVRQYQFKPAMLHGTPVAVAIEIEVNFRRY